jgi:hopanoid biosynthesis associated radical SAM protein HpnH
MPVETAIAAIEEAGAPMVSIAGGEPLVHPEIDVMVRELVARKRFVFLCTNAILMKKKMDLFQPSPYFAWVVHLDGLRERHDRFVEREGIFDLAVEAIHEAKARGFRVNTNTTFLNTDTPKTVREVLDFINDELEVDAMMISPAYAYEKAPDQEHFPGVRQTRRLFQEAFANGNRKRWRLNHTPLFLDFLEGKVDFECTAWGIPSYSVFGWQRPCYLMSDGYAETYRDLVETTDWSKYGRGRDPRCDNCMAHCGYEPTAVLHTTSSLRESLRAVGAQLAEARRQRPVHARQRPVQARRNGKPAGLDHERAIAHHGVENGGGDPIGGNGSRPAAGVGSAAPLEERGGDHARADD